MYSLPCRRQGTRLVIQGYLESDHGREFMLLKTRHSRLGPGAATTNGNQDRKTPGDIGSRGGVLTASEPKDVITDISSAAEFRKLGEQIVTTPRDAFVNLVRQRSRTILEW